MTSEVESVVIALGVLVLAVVLLGTRWAWRNWRAVRGFNRRLHAQHTRHPSTRGRTRAVADGQSWPGPWGQYGEGEYRRGRAVDPGPPGRLARLRERRRRRRRERERWAPPRDDYMPSEFDQGSTDAHR